MAAHNDRTPDTAAQLRARALRHLVRREHSRAELARKLSPYAESTEMLAAVLDELQSKRQLSDERYAEERARALSRKYGPLHIRHDLRAKSIAEEVIDRVVSHDEAARAKAILLRKYREPATTPQERAKRARFLLSRGFSAEVVRRLLRSGEDDAPC